MFVQLRRFGKRSYEISSESQSLLINLRENSEPKLMGIAWLLRSLLTVLFILLFCSSVSWWSKYGDASLSVVLSYELSFHPAAVFEAKNILCTADKPQISRHIM
ncbi:hypothetical protein DPMN_114501 [Dreissena polymorpha]|uniref:Uncharacterized protein n=1 Tax=Dreissena polymorpha TaxID=45954 RepID=A0A9D4KJJ9_DREPO|nr:hypothetical protein DPMN_114501 [Dreissena polymorpha]